MRRAVTVAVVAAVTLGLLAVAPAASSPGGGDLRLNHLQARGTHNSYHRDPGHPFGDAVGWDYSHAPLARQFEEQGVRQVELDVHYNWARNEFEVYHAWFGDDRTTCDLLEDCLAEIRAWSDARPGHHPIMVMIEAKDGGPPRNLALPEDGDPFTRPQGEAEYQELDRILLDAFDGPMHDGGRVITPDDVTVPGLTLRESILHHGWPRIDDVRQHVLYVIDGDEHGAAYSHGWTTLAGRAMFAQPDATRPVAAFVARSGSEVPGGKYARMEALVAQGFMVRDLVDPAGFETAKAAGAHFLSTDHPDELHLSDHPHAPSRCNPVNAPASCKDHRVERHRARDDVDLPDEPSDEPDQVVADGVDRWVLGSLRSALAVVDQAGG